jgi:two-component system sensor histidine kinase/response regulator
VRFQPISCQSVVQEVLTALRPLAEAKNLLLETNLPVDDVVVQTDRRALTQILLNLTNNAIKFTDQGHVRVELRQGQEHGREVTELSVVDTGTGIKPEDQAKLFQAFQQAHTATRERQQGTGLGLHLSQKLAGVLGGQIQFQSQFGRGSTFTLVLVER